jgi:hypothetical protein
VKIEFRETSDDVVYRVFDVESKYEPVLKTAYYRFDGEGWTKTYPRKSKYLDKMKKRYAEKAPLMFDQMGNFVPVPWRAALRRFCDISAGSGLDWWLTGSCATCTRGVELNPHDIDITISSADVPAVTELFQDYLIEPIVDTKGWVTKDFGVAFLDARIDIASDPTPALDMPEPGDCGPYAKNHLETVEWEGFQLKVPPLALQISVNEKRGRLDRVEKMKNFLKGVTNDARP